MKANLIRKQVLILKIKILVGLSGLDFSYFAGQEIEMPDEDASDPAAPGVKIGHREPTTGLRGVAINTVYFDFAEVAEADRLGEEGAGMSIAQAANTQLQLALAAVALGLAEGAVTLGRAFAIERKQFGVSIATKQALGNYFADCEIEGEALRHLIEYAAWLANEG